MYDNYAAFRTRLVTYLQSARILRACDPLKIIARSSRSLARPRNDAAMFLAYKNTRLRNDRRDVEIHGGRVNESSSVREIKLSDLAHIIAVFPPKAVLAINLRMSNKKKNQQMKPKLEGTLFSASSASATDFCATILLLLLTPFQNPSCILTTRIAAVPITSNR